MASFGGNDFSDFSVPLVFLDRFFLLEPGDPSLVTVFRLVNGEPVFEVLRNEPVTGPDVEATASTAGIVTVGETHGGRFLYKVRPGSETSVVFGRLDSGELIARISDREIRVGGIQIQNNRFSGNMAGVVVREDGGVGIGAPIPSEVVRLLGGL